MGKVKRKTTRKTRKTKKTRKTRKTRSTFNKFFSKIFVINLFDHNKKWLKVRNQFKKNNLCC